MSKIRFLWDNRFLEPATALTASSQVTALPVEASQQPDRLYVWRSLQQTGVQTIDIDLGSILSVSCVGVADVRLLGVGVLELYQRGDATSPGSAILVATLSTQDSDRRAAVAFFSGQSHRHWQLKWTNPTGALDYAELGFCHLGDYLEPSVNVSVPLDVQDVDPSIVTASPDGQRTVTLRTAYAAGHFTWGDLTETDRANLRAMWAAVRSAIPLFAVLDTSLSWTSWLLYMASNLTQQFNEMSNRFDMGFEWEEAR